jgi:uncharacterized membrane protein YeaQ/YmgE (transglycosylase-associated protein family)
LFLLNVVYFLLIGLCAGWLAGQKTHGKGFGLTGNLIVGVIGALVGGFILDLIGFPRSTWLASLITATVGAILFLRVLRYFSWVRRFGKPKPKGKAKKVKATVVTKRARR